MRWHTKGMAGCHGRSCLSPALPWLVTDFRLEKPWLMQSSKARIPFKETPTCGEGDILISEYLIIHCKPKEIDIWGNMFTLTMS